MWLNNKTDKSISLKRLLQNPNEIISAAPEPLNIACSITNGIYEQKIEWLLKLEQLASEKDPVTLEKKLTILLTQESQ